jgi:hypothetical protein
VHTEEQLGATVAAAADRTYDLHMAIAAGADTRGLARGSAVAASMFVALGGAALLALAVWLKLARPECLQAEARSGSTPA